MMDFEASRRYWVFGADSKSPASSGSGSYESFSKRFGGFIEAPRPGTGLLLCISAIANSIASRTKCYHTTLYSGCPATVSNLANAKGAGSNPAGGELVVIMSANTRPAAGQC